MSNAKVVSCQRGIPVSVGSVDCWDVTTVSEDDGKKFVKVESNSVLTHNQACKKALVLGGYDVPPDPVKPISAEEQEMVRLKTANEAMAAQLANTKQASVTTLSELETLRAQNAALLAQVDQLTTPKADEPVQKRGPGRPPKQDHE